MFEKLKKAGAAITAGVKEAAEEFKGEETVTIPKVEYERLLKISETIYGTEGPKDEGSN